MKTNIKIALAFVLGLIISGFGVYALNIASKDVSYDNAISASTKTNVQEAIDDLYTKANKPIFAYMSGAAPGGTNPSATATVMYKTGEFTTANSNKTLVIQKPGTYFISVGGHGGDWNDRVFLNGSALINGNTYTIRALKQNDKITGTASHGSAGVAVIISIIFLHD